MSGRGPLWRSSRAPAPDAPTPRRNLAFHVEMEAGTMDHVLAMVQSNLGVGFYPESMAAPALAAGTVFQIYLAEPIPERFVNLIEDTSRPQSVAMKAFKKMLLAPEESCSK